MTTVTMRTGTKTQRRGAAGTRASQHHKPLTLGRVIAYIFMIGMTLIWLVPIIFALYVALRPEASTAKYGYVSLPHGGFTLQNFSEAWTNGQMLQYFINSAVITVPAVVITLFFASAVAFVLSRVSFRGNIALLIIFTAGNLLPQQALITPLYQIFTHLPVPGFLSSSGLLYDSRFGMVVINAAFQMGFCVFVLSNYMTTIPESIYEAALVDGAGVWTQFWKVTLPMIRPALAALATLLTTWIYNDFFWATALMSTGDKRPITSALNNLQGQFVTNQNMIAAAALIAAIPTLIVYMLLQRHMISGLALGATKG